VKKDYKDLLKKEETEREKKMLIILKRMMETDQFKKDKWTNELIFSTSYWRK